jgi:UDP-GlcNAc:undecaprenyl-phosphate GlcNAc-1-phosphate transferase
MNITQISYLSGFVAMLIAYFSTPLVIKLAKKIGIVDDPAKHKHPKVIHTYPVPRGGGIATFVAIVITASIFLPLDKHLVTILLGATLITILGVLDDKYDLNPYLRLGAHIFIAAIPIAAGIGIAFITNPLSGGMVDLSWPRITFDLWGVKRSIWVLSDIFALIWIVFIMQMLNMGAKGVDGQLPGVVGIAAVIIAILSTRYSADITQWPIIILASITAGAYFGFLPWNFYPQKIMPSYSGSTLAGYILAILTILSTTKVGTLMVVLGVPIIDTGYTIARRILTGKSPVWGDRGHLHHKLLDELGWGKRRVAVFYWGVTALLGLFALNLNATNKLYTIIGVALILGGVLLWLTYQSKTRS